MHEDRSERETGGSRLEKAPPTGEACRETTEILIAEDDVTSRTMLAAVFGKWGYQVTSTANGNEAWELLQRDDAPRLLVLDWMMPGIDGLTLCRRLREQDRDAPFYIILLTSKSERENIVEGLDAGADDYIAKPYDNSELRARVNAGARILSLQEKLRERERLQGVLEMAGAVCHELNQPLHIVLNYTEMVAREVDSADPVYGMLQQIQNGVDRIGKLTNQIMHISKYRSRPYLSNGTIIDIEEASRVDDAPS